MDDEKRNPIDFGSRGKSQLGTLCIRLWDTIQTTVYSQPLSNFTCKLCMMRGGTLLIWGHGSKVNVNFGPLCLRPCGHDTEYSFAQSLSNFTCESWMIRGGTLLILGHGVISQGQLLPTPQPLLRGDATLCHV